MYAIHQTVLPPSAIHHSLFLPNFTPSTIYPVPQPHSPDAPQVKVVGNLIVAGGNDLRVFEIREAQVASLSGNSNGIKKPDVVSDEEGEIEEGMEEDFYDIGHEEVCNYASKIVQRYESLTTRLPQ
jgi:cleavage and polyadenylation specificity factor subunit 1